MTSTGSEPRVYWAGFEWKMLHFIGHKRTTLACGGHPVWRRTDPQRYAASSGRVAASALGPRTGPLSTPGSSFLSVDVRILVRSVGAAALIRRSSWFPAMYAGFPWDFRPFVEGDD